MGDPACDLAIAWTFFENESREVFHTKLSLDDGTWARGRAWALWKALIVAAGFTGTKGVETAQSFGENPGRFIPINFEPTIDRFFEFGFFQDN